MQRSALVVYGSETGTAQDAAEEMGRIAERLHFDSRVTDLNSIGLASDASRFRRSHKTDCTPRATCCATAWC